MKAREIKTTGDVADIVPASISRRESKVVEFKKKTSLQQKLKHLYASDNYLPKLIDDPDLAEHSLEDYYVKLQIILKDGSSAPSSASYDQSEAIAGEKKPVELKDMFEPIDEAHTGANKLLLLGAAGIGKSTLMHYISYKWGCGDLWDEQYSYVFRLRLKNLLNDNWTKNPKYDLDEYALACFIHSCLPRDMRKEFKVEDINAHIGAGALFLLDGYDEVAGLVTGDGVARDVFDEVMEQKHIVMTSRPNAVGDAPHRLFGVGEDELRLLENIGLDQEGIEQYINHSLTDKSQAEAFREFLLQNAVVRGICTTPINMAMMCLIWQDKSVREKLAGEEFTLNTLYQQMIIWLGKRYLSKFADGGKGEDVTNYSDGQILASDELNFLKDLAFDGFIKGQLIIESNLIKEELRKEQHKALKIAEVNKYGLLRAEGEGNKVIDKNHVFIHLTFQEYLLALRLRDYLLEDQEVIDGQKASEFTADHRNEPKYLMSLKFLAGIIDDERFESDSKKTKLLVARFWEAVSCNIDGVIELGVEQKVKLLMHLLGQIRLDDTSNIKIPNLDKMQEFIDDVVKQNLFDWQTDILNSGYMSSGLKLYMREKLSADIADERELLAIFEILAGNRSFDDMEDIICKVLSYLNHDSWVLRKESIIFLSKVVPVDLSEDVKDRIVQSLFDGLRYELVDGKKKAPDVISAFDSSIGNILKTLKRAEEGLRLLEPLLKDDDSDVRGTAVSNLGEIIKAAPERAEQGLELLAPFIKERC